MYPCVVKCSEPHAGKVGVTARYMGLDHEWVTLTNKSSSAISLYQYELESSPWFYEFGPGDVIQPGKSIVVWINKPHPVPTAIGSRGLVTPRPGVPPFSDVQLGGFRSWLHSDALLSDNKDMVALRNPLGIPVPGACDAWGGVPCPKI